MDTPQSERLHIVFAGCRNAGKSSLVNTMAGQQVSIVSDVPGTTTDPVAKAVEIPGLGPCILTDTAGLDDAGVLGQSRLEKARDRIAGAEPRNLYSLGHRVGGSTGDIRDYGHLLPSHRIDQGRLAGIAAAGENYVQPFGLWSIHGQ
jgi:hypothetical protein